jgi:AdoMet-dependent heme synthase
MTVYQPYLIAVNLTRRCNLDCAHCYIDANARMTPGLGKPEAGELTADQLQHLFSDIADRAPGTMMVLTGGEPLLRHDIVDLVRLGTDVGLRMVLGTNGLLLNEAKLTALQAAGLQGVGISLDDTHPLGHDTFRGVPGAFEKTCNAIRLCAKHGMHAQVHFTVTRRSQDEIEDVVAMSKDLGAALVNFFFLVCVGRGSQTMDLSPQEYDKALRRVARMQRESVGIMVQSRCTPHFKRILYEADPQSPFTRATGYDGGGCPAGTHYARITPEGEITPCPYMELSGGNVKREGFWKTWDHSTLFQSFRNPDLLQGRCGSCEYKLICGGCRARALAQGGNLMGEDPNCDYVPSRTASRIEPGAGGLTAGLWTDDARMRFERLPLFLRGMVKKRLEERSRREGAPITVDMMQRHRSESRLANGLAFDTDAEPPAFVKAMLERMNRMPKAIEGQIPKSSRSIL